MLIKCDGKVTASFSVTLPSRPAVTVLLVYSQCIIRLLVTDDSNFEYFNSWCEDVFRFLLFTFVSRTDKIKFSNVSTSILCQNNE